MDEIKEKLKTEPSSTALAKELLEACRLKANNKESLIEGWKHYLKYNLFFEEDYTTLKKDGIDVESISSKPLQPIPLPATSDPLTVFLFFKENSNTSSDVFLSFFAILEAKGIAIEKEMLETYIVVQQVGSDLSTLSSLPSSSSSSSYWNTKILPIISVLDDDLLIVAFSKLILSFQSGIESISELDNEYISKIKDPKKRLTCYRWCLKITTKATMTEMRKFYEEKIIPYNERSAWMDIIYYEMTIMETPATPSKSLIRNLFQRSIKDYPSLLVEWRKWELLNGEGPTMQFLHIFEEHKAIEREQQQRKKAKKMNDTNTVFLNNLSFQVREDEIVRHFRDHLGIGVHVVVKKGYGYATFDSAFKKDVLLLDRKPLAGRPLFISEYQLLPKNERNNNISKKSLTLFISHLPLDVEISAIRSLFDSECSIRMVRDREGLFRGIAYVEFEKEEDALRAKLASDHTTYRRLGHSGDGYISVQISNPPGSNVSGGAGGLTRKNTITSFVPRQISKK